MDNLEDVLNGSTPVETPVADIEAQAPEPVQEAIPGPPRDEHGRFASTGETPPTAEVVEEGAPPAPDRSQVPAGALTEERRKRQDAEARLAQFEQHFAQLQQAQQPAAQPFIPSVYEDENGFAHGLTQQAVQMARQQLMPEMQQSVQNLRIEIARETLAGIHTDFAETEASFFEMARENPVLMSEMNRQANPVKWAYDYAKKAQEVRNIGSLDLAAIKQAAVAEYLAAQTPATAPQIHIPSTLADAQSARGSIAAAPTGPPSLNDILGRR